MLHYRVVGPCAIDANGNLTWNPYSWNERANIFFIDQPINTGFSYAEYGEYVVCPQFHVQPPEEIDHQSA